MALTLYRTEGTVLVDLAAAKWCDFKLVSSYSHPATLTWTALVPQHSIPIFHGEGVRFFDSNFSATIPIFEGYVENVKPGQSANEVHITAYGADYRAGEEIVITNGLGTLVTAIPRAVYNVTVDADEDKGFEQLTYPRSSTSYGETATYATVGQIIKDVIDNQITKLRAIWAAPAAGDPYVQAELDALDFQPQEKIVFDSEGITPGLQRLMQLYPAKRIFFDCSTRQWRIHSVVESGAQTTLTFNQTASAANPVLACNLDRNLERRFTAFKLVGKPELAFADVRVSDGTLTEFPETVGGNIGYCRRWQIADVAKRHLYRLLRPSQWVEINIPFGAGHILTYLLLEHATLLASWDEGGSWEFVPEFKLQISTGVITTPTYLWHRSGEAEPDPPGYTLTPPDDVRFVFDYFKESIYIRHPLDGYSGTAFSTFGIARLKTLYHELLNTGYADWDTSTEDYKRRQYEKLAAQVHAAYSEPVYSGGAVLHGLDYQFLRLGKRLNFTSLNPDGTALTTGWEAAKAAISDVEYDFAANGVGTTAPTWNSDMAEFGGTDVDLMRKHLKIAARAIYREVFRAGWEINPGSINTWMGWQQEKIGEEG